MNARDIRRIYLVIAALVIAPPSAMATDDITTSREYLLLEKDSRSGTGLWVEGALLETYRSRLDLRSKLTDPMVAYAEKPSEEDFRDVFSYASGVFGVPAFFIGMSTTAQESGVWKAIKHGAAGGMSSLGLFFSMAVLPPTLSESPGLTDDQSAQIGHYYFRRHEQQLGQKQYVVDRNEAHRVGFEGQIATVSKEISEHLATVLGLPESQEILLQRRIGQRLHARFKTKSVWDHETRVSVDLPSLMKEIDTEATLRLEIFDREVRAARAAKVPLKIDNAADIRNAYDHLISVAERAHENSMKNFTSLNEKKEDRKLQQLARRYWDHCVALEIHLSTLRTHQRLLPPTEK